MKRILTPFLLMALTVAGCATFQPDPSATEAAKTRKTAIIVMNSITTGLGIYQSMLEVADVQEKAGQVSPATLRDLATLGKSFASVSDKALTALGTVTTMPTLNNTVAFVTSQLEPLIARLDASGKDTLRAFGVSLRVILDFLNQYAVVGDIPRLGGLIWVPQPSLR